LVDRVGIGEVRVIVSPIDLRHDEPARALTLATRRPRWLPDLYQGIAAALEPFRLPVDDAPRATRPARRRRAACKAWDAADCGSRCGAGDAASCAHAGVMYAVGRGRPRDPERAWALLTRACAGGDMFGCAELARLHLEDEGPRRDVVRAAALAEIACDSGNGHGCALLARLCTDRLIYPERPDDCSVGRVRQLRRSAVARLRADCSGWNAVDCTALATIYDPGDISTALRFAGGACQGGDPRGCEALARIRGGPGVSPLLATAR
jgi:TPR repeat protein